MRQALNENPKIQAAVVAVLLLVVGVMLMKSLKGGSSGGAAATTAQPLGATAGAAAAAPVSSDSASPDAAAAAPAAPTASATPPPVASEATISSEALVPGPGLPPELVKAWKAGNAIVLLIEGGGVDDAKVRASVTALSNNPGVAVFVARADKVARYSRITQSVGLNRVPALIVIRPRRVSRVPEATVSYGFRNAQSVAQAVNDALYEGRDNAPYHPG